MTEDPSCTYSYSGQDMKKINELYGIHLEDIYILGAGSSLDYVNNSFFDGKITIGLNFVYRDFQCSYMLSHHHCIVQDAINEGANVITSEWETCREIGLYHNFHGSYYIYKHTWQSYSEVNLTKFPKVICAAGTPAVAALQVAYLMGAKNIILVGVDGGKIDGQYHYKKYTTGNKVSGHAGRVEKVVRETANRIRREGVGVYSINPFTNFTFEGHKFTDCDGLWNDAKIDKK